MGCGSPGLPQCAGIPVVAEAGTVTVAVCFTLTAAECLRADAEGAADEGLFTLPEARRPALPVFLVADVCTVSTGRFVGVLLEWSLPRVRGCD